jgi:hypothetical protein
LIRLDDAQGRTVVSILRGLMETHNVGHLVEQIEDQLNNPNHDVDLVERIAGVLTSGNSRVMITGRMLDQLNKAVLNPRELARADALSSSRQNCNRCGESIRDGMMITMFEGYAYCHMCHMPEVLRCTGCREHLPFPQGVGRVVTKAIKECVYCRDRAARQEAGAQIPAPPPDRMPTLADYVTYSGASSARSARPRPDTGGITFERIQPTVSQWAFLGNEAPQTGGNVSVNNTLDDPFTSPEDTREGR